MIEAVGCAAGPVCMCLVQDDRIIDFSRIYQIVNCKEKLGSGIVTCIGFRNAPIVHCTLFVKFKVWY